MSPPVGTSRGPEDSEIRRSEKEWARSFQACKVSVHPEHARVQHCKKKGTPERLQWRQRESAQSGCNLLAQETEIRLLAKLLPNVRGMFVDIGAEQGSWAKFLIGEGFRGVCFEPLPKHQSALVALAATGAIRQYTFAIDQDDRRAEFHIACDASGQPLDHFHSLQHLSGDHRVQHKKTISVVCRSLSSLHGEGLIDQHLSVLKIDTEGNDLRVLRGLGPVRAEVIICEFFTKGVYSGWPEAEPSGLIAEARKIGYPWWIAVRRRGAAELVALCPTEFTEQEWGNLIFLSDSIFKSAQNEIGHVVAESEARLFAALELQSARKRRRWLPWASG